MIVFLDYSIIFSKDIKFGVSFQKRTSESKDRNSKRKEEWVVEPGYPLHSSKPNVGYVYSV